MENINLIQAVDLAYQLVNVVTSLSIAGMCAGLIADLKGWI